MIHRVFLFVGLFVLAASAARAQDISQATPLSVSGVTIDKTDKTAVQARAAAMQDARREAFRQLAARNPGADGATAPVPDDAALASVVQDIEITSERLSATRYVGTFTVRFRDDVRRFVDVRAVDVPAAAKPLLLLPYYETAAGRLLLWEEDNAWLKAWQTASPDAAVVIPEGDIEDVATGSTDAAWSGDMSMLEKIRAKYGTDDVALAVATENAGALSVDLYLFRAGRLETLPSLARPAGDDDRAAVMQAGIAAVRDALKSRPLTARSDTPAVPASAPAQIEADMAFDAPGDWLAIQKKIEAVSPPVVLHLKSLSSTGARVTLSYAPGVEALTQALAAQGVEMARPAIEVNPAALSPDAAAADAPLYVLKLVH